MQAGADKTSNPDDLSAAFYSLRTHQCGHTVWGTFSNEPCGKMMSTATGVFAIFAESESVVRKSEVKGYVLDVDAKPVENLQESSA